MLAVEDDWFTDKFPLDAQGIMEAAVDKWIVGPSELTDFSQDDLTVLKSLLSRQYDEARLSYQREVTCAPRRFVVISTSNETDCLHDTTGSRRFWPVHVLRFDLERLRADRDAEALPMNDVRSSKQSASR